MATETRSPRGWVSKNHKKLCVSVPPWWTLFCVLTSLCVLGCRRDAPSQATASSPRHVLIITIDTLRADRLGGYGNRDVATPNMDRLAREGAMAPEASVQVPLTRPSHASIFTGLYPAQHGIRDNISAALAADVPTMAEAFKAGGFTTAGFVSSIVLSAQSGLGRGFDEFSDRFDLGADAGDEARFLDILEKRGDVAVADAVKWLDGHAADRTFVWVHLYDPHAPYEPPEPYASRYAGRPYDGEVAWSDELVGRLDAALTRLAIRDQTLIALTSDHGEALGEHGEAVHGFFLYEATLRVPLLLRGPGVRPGTRIPVLVRSVDLFPTLLELAGVPTPKTARALAGRSLASMARGGPATLHEEPSFAESLTPRIHYGWSDLRSIRDGRWKFILAPKPELYDLARDPDERNNLANAEPARARALRAGLDRHLADDMPATIRKTATSDVPADLVARLGALGYVGVGGAADRSAGADPKDKIEDYKVLNGLLHEGLLQLRDKEYAASAARFRDLEARGIDSFESHYYFGQALVGLGRWRDAAAEFERAIPRLPGFAASYLTLADCRVAVRDRKGAIDALRRGERAVPSDARLYRRLGELYRDGGDFPHAAKYFREGIARDPGEASQWNSLGMILGASEELGEAERAFREAVQRDPREPRYTYNLGLTLQREQRADEAVPYFRKTLELNPRFAAARDRLAETRSLK
ncbi:MAG: sulfatase-like hydrolase/transferase [Acidobacteria bacterium]|nr:sulfatase-like hydrolase/transferase [Acidobacteriota bacterium]